MPETVISEHSQITALANKWTSFWGLVGTLEHEQIRLNDWETSGKDDCHYWVQCLTRLLEVALEISVWIEQQYGPSPYDGPWEQLLRDLDNFHEQGNRVIRPIAAYSVIDHPHMTDALDLLQEARMSLSDLLLAALALENKLARILAEQGMDILTMFDNDASPILPIYPTGHGPYAIGHPKGRVISPGWRLTVRIGGHQFAGRVQRSLLGYYLQLKDGSCCGLCPAMTIVVTSLEKQRLEQELATIDQERDPTALLVKNGQVHLVGSLNKGKNTLSES